MPNKNVTWTQVPVIPDTVQLEAYPTFDSEGVYIRHEIRMKYRYKDDQGVERGRGELTTVPLTSGQRTTLASFITVCVGHANTHEGT